MSVVRAAGHVFKQVVVYPGVHAHFLKVRGSTETMRHHLMPRYVYQRDPAGVDSSIFAGLAGIFLDEVNKHRMPGENLLLLYDGYSCHIQYTVLKRFRDYGIYVVCFPLSRLTTVGPYSFLLI